MTRRDYWLLFLTGLLIAALLFGPALVIGILLWLR
jgi:hypothetical protein